MTDEYLFIDGGCLRATLKKIGERYANGEELILNYEKFTQGYKKVFYYDALPDRAEGETDEDFNKRVGPQISLLDSLRTLDRFHVYEGDVRRARSRRERPEQKKVDVMITVDMLTHSFKRNMQSATLLTSDLDFTPLLSALVQEGLFVTLYYPPSDTHKDLIAAADGKTPLGIDSIYDALMPESKALFEVPRSITEKAKGDFAEVVTECQTDQGARVRIVKDYNAFTAEIMEQDAQIATYASLTDQVQLMRYVEDVWQVKFPQPDDEAQAGVAAK